MSDVVQNPLPFSWKQKEMGMPPLPAPSWEATGSNSRHLSKVNLMQQRPNLRA